MDLSLSVSTGSCTAGSVTSHNYLEHPPLVEPKKPARTEESGAASTPRTDTKPKPKTPRPLSPTDQLVADLLIAGGVLRVPQRRAVGDPDYEQRVIAAKRFGKVPPGKRLRTSYEGGELEIRLEDAPPGTEINARPVRLSRSS